MKTPILPAIVLGISLAPAAAAAQEVVQGSISVQGSAQAQAPVVQQPPPAMPPPTMQPPPQYPVYQQPAYGYGYGYGQPVVVVQGRARQRVVPYSGGPIPPGAHIEERGVPGLTIAGSITFGIFYGASLFTGVLCTGSSCGSSGLGWLMVPVAGPIIALAGYPQTEEGARLLVLDTIFQAAGAGMLIAGVAARHQVLVYDSVARTRPRRGIADWALTPGAPGTPAGLSLAFTHF